MPIEAGREIHVTGAYPAIAITQRSASGANPTPASAPSATPGAGFVTANAPLATSSGSPNTDIRPEPAQPAPIPTSNQPPAPDDFRDWVESSQPDAPASATPRHASLQMTGSEDLGSYGQWQSLDDYGPVWFPTSVPTDWAPYRFGHWTSVAPWGWTWIDDQPWGFAPFHFGRWVYIDDHWGWALVPRWILLSIHRH